MYKPKDLFDNDECDEYGWTAQGHFLMYNVVGVAFMENLGGFSPSTEAQRLRDEYRTWLASHFPEGTREDGEDGHSYWKEGRVLFEGCEYSEPFLQFTQSERFNKYLCQKGRYMWGVVTEHKRT